MAPAALTTAETDSIRSAVSYFTVNRARFKRYAKILHTTLAENEELRPLLHSSKYRVKDPGHLYHKLERKLLKAKSECAQLDVSAVNLFVTIGDLAGVRLIHLHTDQFTIIQPIIRSILDEAQYRILEGPTAKTWDREYQSYFESLGIHTEVAQDSMYTSVHYIIEENSKSRLRCELQVRTLSEELWAEVSHTVDYPDPTPSIACREQLKVLARLTTGSTRLVDSIFKSRNEHAELLLRPKTTGSPDVSAPKPSAAPIAESEINQPPP